MAEWTLTELRALLDGFVPSHWEDVVIGHRHDEQSHLFERPPLGLRPCHAQHQVYAPDPRVSLRLDGADEVFDHLAEIAAGVYRPITFVLELNGVAVIGLRAVEIHSDDPNVCRRSGVMEEEVVWLAGLDETDSIAWRDSCTPLLATATGVADPFDLMCELNVEIHPTDSDLSAASLYQRTVVEVELDGTLHHVRSGDLAGFVITAYNPGDDRPTAEQNGASNRQLREDLEAAIESHDDGALGEVLTARGSSFDGVHAEPSHFVTGIARSTARELGRKYRQVAIFELSSHGVHVVGCFGDWRLPVVSAPLAAHCRPSSCDP